MVTTVGHTSRLCVRTLNLLLVITALFGLGIRRTEAPGPVIRLRTVEVVAGAPAAESQAVSGAPGPGTADDGVPRSVLMVSEWAARRVAFYGCDLNRS